MRRHARGRPDLYAKSRGIHGCATKMLLGRPCASDGKALLPADAERAISVLRERFAFVGLLEHWNVSVCIFHSLMMRGTPPDPAELMPTHLSPQRRRAAADGMGSFHDESSLRGFVDKYDEQIYAAASARFWADARRTGCHRKPAPSTD